MKLSRYFLVLLLTAASVAILLWKLPRLGLDLRGGTSFLLEVRAEDSTRPRGEVLEESQRIVERKINAYGLTEATVQPYGSDQDRLLVQIPGGGDLQRIRESLKRQGVVEWLAVAQGPFPDEQEASRQLVLGARVLPAQTGGWYVLRGPAAVRGADLQNARLVQDGLGNWVTAFTLSNQAGERFGQFTEANLGRRTAIVLDGRIISVAVIEERIRSEGQIRGAGSQQEAEDLAISLRAGAMPAAVRILHEATVEASLGADSLRQGLRAGLAGLGAVVATMVVYYRGAGVNAAVALLLNALFLLALLVLCDAVLTLPGIAGLVLTIGMAVDSNVLIFERIRESRRERPLEAAIDQGFRRAWSTIVDTHVTTIVSCAFLFAFGTAAVKGFAAVLVLGLLSNVFTSVYVSRLLFELAPRHACAIHLYHPAGPNRTG